MKTVLSALGIALALAAPSSGSIIVRVNGEPVDFSGIGPRYVNGRVMVPLRGVLEKTGAYVDWISSSQTVVATKGDTNIELPIGSRTAKVNGQSVRLEVPAMTIAGNTMVPLRFVSESLGAVVAWDNRRQIVNIETTGEAASEASVTYRGNREGMAHRDRERAVRPVMDSFTHNLPDNWIMAGKAFHCVAKGTPGGQAWFRIRGTVSEVKMRETSPGVYEGWWRNNTGNDVHVSDNDILSFIVVGNISTPEVTAGGFAR